MNRKFKIIVLAKQVPDTRQVGRDAMNADGTVNRAALPAVFNPDDLNALELALEIKDRCPGSTVTMLTMGPERAKDIVLEGMQRGADAGVLLTDRLFAGADTLATSYALSMAICRIGEYDMIVCGRQAIDGDTAQVGPQGAQKLDIDQGTYVESVDKVCEECGKVTVTRRIDGGIEKVEAPMPCLLTITGSAAPCRPRNAKLVMTHKKAEPAQEGVILQWGAADINADLQQCGLAGSPTKVKEVQNIVFKAKESKQLTASDSDVEGLIKELLESHTIG